MLSNLTMDASLLSLTNTRLYSLTRNDTFHEESTSELIPPLEIHSFLVESTNYFQLRLHLYTPLCIQLLHLLPSYIPFVANRIQVKYPF